MQWLRAFAIGLGVAIVLALTAGGGLFAFERLRAVTIPALHVSGPGSGITIPNSPSPSANLEPGGQEARTKELLEGWQTSGVDPGAIKGRIMDAALVYFASQTKIDEGPLRSKISVLSASDYASKSTSDCQDAADVRSSNEAWLLDIRTNSLFVNDGFTPTTKQSAVDLFFRYTVGLYNLAPELKSYPTGVKSSDGTTAYYEKGLILLGRRTLDQLANTSCYLQYRRPLQEAYTADRALALVARLGFAPASDYAYPQKANLDIWRTKITPRLDSSADLLEPYLKTDSGEFYRRVGKALGADTVSSEGAADKLFRGAFPAS